MIVWWQELMLSFLFVCLITIVWLAWEMAQCDELDIDLSMDELKDDLYNGLHFHRGDEE